MSPITIKAVYRTYHYIIPIYNQKNHHDTGLPRRAGAATSKEARAPRERSTSQVHCDTLTH